MHEAGGRCCRNSARLGQSLRIPFRDDYLALHISLIFSIIFATSMRALEIVACGFYPGLPRFAIARTMLSWVRAPDLVLMTHPLLSEEEITCIMQGRVCWHMLAIDGLMGCGQTCTLACKLIGKDLELRFLTAIILFAMWLSPPVPHRAGDERRGQWGHAAGTRTTARTGACAEVGPPALFHGLQLAAGPAGAARCHLEPSGCTSAWQGCDRQERLCCGAERRVTSWRGACERQC